MKLEDSAIGRLLRRLASCAGDRAEVRRSILADLEGGGVPHQVQTLGDAGANIVVNPGPETRLAFSAHYDGDDLNDNLCSVAVLLALVLDGLPDRCGVVLTDLEEAGGRGMQHYVWRCGTNVPMVILELTGVGDALLIGTSVFGIMPQRAEVPLDPLLVGLVEECARSMGLQYRTSCVPPGDHLAYASSGGRCVLVSRGYEADLTVIERMRRGAPPEHVFDGLGREDTAIGRIHPFGRTRWDDLNPNALGETLRLAQCIISCSTG